MKRIVRLTENDLSRIVKRVLLEQNDPSLDTCDWFIPDTYLIDNRKGELQMTNVRPGQWVVTKFSNPNDATSPTRNIAITVPLSNQLQVIWNSQTKSISLTGPSLIGMSAYNTIFGTNKNATDCFVLCETQSNDGPKLSVGIIKLNKSNNLPVGNTTEVRLQNGAVITYRNSHYVGRKRRYDKDNSLNTGRVYGTIEIGQNFTFNEFQRKCK